MFKRFTFGLIVVALFVPSLSAAATCPNLYRNLSFGSRGQDVVELQNFLIAQGDLAAGNNTGYFGRLTEAAVKKFQARNGLVSSGTAATTGYGAVGPRTRAKIASVCGGGGGTISQNFTATPLAGPMPLAVTFSINNLPGLLPPDSGTWFSVDFGDGSQEPLDSWSTDQTRQHTYTKVGTYSAKLIRTSNPCAKVMNCNVKTSVDLVGTVEILVFEKVTKPEVPFQATPQTGTAPLAVTFTTEAYSYSWTDPQTGVGSQLLDAGELYIDFGDGSVHYRVVCPNSPIGTKCTPTVTHVYQKSGTYTAALFSSGMAGVSKVKQAIIQVQ